jgi:hypothetical protein
VAAQTVRDLLAARDIAVTVSRRGSTLVDMDSRGLDAVVRASRTASYARTSSTPPFGRSPGWRRPHSWYPPG